MYSVVRLCEYITLYKYYKYVLLFQIFFLGIFMLTALTSSTLAQYNYEPPLKHGGYNYSPPEVSFNEAPPSKPFSTLQASTSAPKIADKTLAPVLGYIYSKPNVSFTLPTPIKISTTTKPPSNFDGLPTHVPNLTGYEYAHPAISFAYPSINSKSNPTSIPPLRAKINGYSYPKPSSPLTLFPTFKPKESVLKPPTSHPNPSGYTYTHPAIPFTISKVGESHSLTVPTPQPATDYSYTTPTLLTDFTLDASISPIQSTNTTYSPKTIGYTYMRPAVSFTVPPRITKDKPTQLTKFKGYSYPIPKVSLTLPNIHPKSKGNLKAKQENFLQTQTMAYTEVSANRSTGTMSPTPSKGYSYSPPEVPFTLPLKNSITRSSKVQITHPTGSSFKSISSPETSPLEQANGYVYSQPGTPFKTPTRSEITISSLVIQPVPPTKSLPESNGYSYIPPDVAFTVPSSTPATNHLPTKILGYTYKRPKVPLTTSKKTSKTNTPPSSILLKSQKQTKPTINSNHVGPPEFGYSYPKPAIPFGF